MKSLFLKIFRTSSRYNRKNDKTDKEIPSSLGDTLRNLRLREGLTQKQLETEIKKLYPQHRRFSDGMDQNTIGGHELCSSPLNYGQLEAYESYYGMPTGVILAVSHLYSYIREEKQNDAEKFAEGLEALAKQIRDEFKIKDCDYKKDYDYTKCGPRLKNPCLQRLIDIYFQEGVIIPRILAENVEDTEK